MPQGDYAIVDPSTLQDKVREALQYLQDVIAAGLERIIRLAKAAIAFASSTLNLPGAAALGYLLHHFEGKIPEIWAKFKEVCSVIWDWIGKLLGNPVTLWDLALSYQNARAVLAETDQPIGDIVGKVAIEWEGKASTAFQTAMTEQQSAWDAVNAGLDTAADLVAQHADNLCQLWIDELQSLTDTTSGVVNGLASAADLGKALGAEIAPIVAVITAVGTGLVSAASPVLATIATQAGTGTNNWNSLNAGVSGLDSNDWPVIDSYYSGTVSNPGSWSAVPS